MKKIWTNPELRHQFFLLVVTALLAISVTLLIWSGSRAYILEGFEKLLKQW